MGFPEPKKVVSYQMSPFEGICIARDQTNGFGKIWQVGVEWLYPQTIVSFPFFLGILSSKTT